MQQAPCSASVLRRELLALGAVQSTNAATVEIENANATKRTVELVSVPAADAQMLSLYTSRPTTAER
jgi:hypothetical protein